MRRIDADAVIKETTEARCVNCDRRKGMKNGKMTFVYEIGEAPCRACDVMDMIDTLDEAPTVGDWISVKDRLPMLIETVLFIGKNYYGNWCGVKRGYFDGLFWHSYDYGTIYSTTPVTHWMPLPEPPEEDNQDAE